MTNEQLVKFCEKLFKDRAKGITKHLSQQAQLLDAQVMAVALATYVTNRSLIELPFNPLDPANPLPADPSLVARVEAFGFQVADHGVGEIWPVSEIVPHQPDAQARKNQEKHRAALVLRVSVACRICRIKLRSVDHNVQGGRIARNSMRLASASSINRSALGSHRSERPRRRPMFTAWQMVVARWALSG